MARRRPRASRCRCCRTRCPGTGKRALARWGLLGEGAGPVFAAGAWYPLAGLLLALPALEATGLLEAARQIYGRLCDGYYGLAATLLTLVFLALAGEPGPKAPDG